MLIKLFRAAVAARSLRDSRSWLREAIRAYAADDLEAAVRWIEKSLGDPNAPPDALFWRGALALAGGEPERARACFSAALARKPEHPPYLAGLGAALLLLRQEAAALECFRRAMPGTEEDDQTDDETQQPYRRSHPLWLRYLSNVSAPRPPARWTSLETPPEVALEDIEPASLANYAALLANRGRAVRATRLFWRALELEPACAPARAALPLIHTLNRNWAAAAETAAEAKRRRAQAFDHCNELCLLASSLGLGGRPGDLDDFLDWTPLSRADAPAEAYLDVLPAVPRDGFVLPRRYPLVVFIACDALYFREHALALVWSIRETNPGSAVHLHLFSPPDAVASEVEALRSGCAPLDLSATYETVDFDRFGGKSAYCQAARFCRLNQWIHVNADRVAMIDADSLVRADLVAPLSTRGDIGCVSAPNEPIWHDYLAGFTTFRPTPASRAFLARVSALLAANLAQGRGPFAMDQVALYVVAHLERGAGGFALDALPQEFCDTTFLDSSRVWSITQDKDRAGPFAAEKRAVLERAHAHRRARA